MPKYPINPSPAKTLDMDNLDLLIKRLEEVPDDEYNHRLTNDPDNDYRPMNLTGHVLSLSMGMNRRDRMRLNGVNYLDFNEEPLIAELRDCTEWLSMDRRSGAHLFYWCPYMFTEPQVSREQVLKVLRHLRTSRVVDWNVIFDNDAVMTS